jgi:hypothetical protein
MTTRSVRLLGAGLLALVLGSGIAMGVALDRLWLKPDAASVKKHHRATKRSRDPQVRTDRLMKRFQKKLDLDAAQEKTVREAVHQMFTETRELRRKSRPVIRKTREQARTKIRAALRPDQRARYEKMLNAYLARKARRRAKRRAKR